MANYRQIHVSIWKDEWFLDLEPDEKLLFIYLFSNESASLAGIYKIALKVIAFESNLPIDFVKSTLAKFEQAEKVYYRDGIVWVKNLRKYNRGSSKVDIRIQLDIEEIPDGELKRIYLDYYSTETENIPDKNYPDTPSVLPDTPPIPYTDDIDTISSEMNLKEYESLHEIEEEERAIGASAPAATPLQKPPPKKQNIRGDPRSKHPAILCIHGIARKYPPLEIYDDLIQTLGEHPDGVKLAGCRKEWVERGYNPNSWKWVGWYFDGIPRQGKNGTGPPKKSEPAGFAGIRAWLEEQQEDVIDVK